MSALSVYCALMCTALCVINKLVLDTTSRFSQHFSHPPLGKWWLAQILFLCWTFISVTNKKMMCAVCVQTPRSSCVGVHKMFLIYSEQNGGHARSIGTESRAHYYLLILPRAKWRAHLRRTGECYCMCGVFARNGFPAATSCVMYLTCVAVYQ